MMTDEREMEIINQARNNYIRGVTKDEVQYFELKYGGSCANYSCGKCILNYLKINVLPKCE